MMFVRLLKKFLFLSFLLVLCASPATAVPTIALTYTGGDFGTSSQTRGWDFNTSAPVRVDALGWFDFGSDGLIDSHEVGIWTDTGILLLSGTVQAGTVESSSK